MYSRKYSNFIAEMEWSHRLDTGHDESLLCNKTKCQFNIDEAKAILASLSLKSVTFEDYLIVMRSEFDVNILGQPYLALMLLFNVKSPLTSLHLPWLSSLQRR